MVATVTGIYGWTWTQGHDSETVTHLMIRGGFNPVEQRFERFRGLGMKSWGATPRQATREMLVSVSPEAIGPLDWPHPNRGMGSKYQRPVSVTRYRKAVPIMGLLWPGYPREVN